MTNYNAVRLKYSLLLKDIRHCLTGVRNNFIYTLKITNIYSSWRSMQHSLPIAYILKASYNNTRGCTPLYPNSLYAKATPYKSLESGHTTTYVGRYLCICMYYAMFIVLWQTGHCWQFFYLWVTWQTITKDIMYILFRISFYSFEPISRSWVIIRYIGT